SPVRFRDGAPRRTRRSPPPTRRRGATPSGRATGPSRPDGSLRPQTGERQGNPVQIRNGPAAVRGDAPTPHATGHTAGKAAREGAPSQKTSAAGKPEPLAEGGFVFHRLSVAFAALALAL